MNKVFTGVGAALIVAIAAVAFAANSPDSNPRTTGANIDTVTFPDGTVASSAYVGGSSSINIVLIQIKQLDGKICYGLSTQNAAGGTSISCLP